MAVQLSGSGDRDRVIVRAGSAGCILANRLSANAGSRVLLAEAGGKNRSLWFRVPVVCFGTIGDSACDWRYRTDPETRPGDRQLE